MQARLEDIVGKEKVVDDPEVLKAYSQDQSLVEPKMPQVVVFAEEAKQVQEVVKMANQEKVPIVPFSSGLNFHGATIPVQGGIILNLSKMDKILEVNEKDWWALIEPGVTYGQLQDELAPLGLRAMIPWGVPPGRSVLSSQMERDANLSYSSFEYGAERMLDIELVLPEGDFYRTGGWSIAEKPQGSFNLQHRFWTGAQGTLGIVSRMGLKLEYLPQEGRVFFLGFDKFDEVWEGILLALKKGFHPINNWFFQYGARLDINAWVKHKYHGRYADASEEDRALLNYGRIELIARKISGRPMDAVAGKKEKQ